ncbi:MAG: sugar phosphate isomerase/epimerase family protein, partial [Mycobacterium sp.]
RGILLALEPMPLTNVVTIAQGRDLVEAASHPAVGLCVDVWHVERGRSPLADVRNLPVERIVAVEIDDAPAERVGSFFEDTIFNRRLPGEGDFDVAGFVDAIRATGFDGPWGVEILSEVQRRLPVNEAVDAAFGAAKVALGEADPAAPLKAVPTVATHR